MKHLFFLCLGLLGAASALTYWFQPEQQSEHPILYWTVQADESRQRVRSLFYAWRAEQGLPPVELRLDAANRDPTKKLIQGVSGVGGDLLDVGITELMPLQNAGLLLDLTETAAARGFSPEVSFPSIRNEITVDGRQYTFPGNIGVSLLWVHRDAFEQYGLPIPPHRWTIAEFEDLGRRFVAAANAPDQRERVYFVNAIPRFTLRRSLGLSIFNETMTRCTLDDPRNIELMAKVETWVNVDQLAPTREAEMAFAADASGFTLKIALFARGQYGMLYLGRWAVKLLRQRPPVNLAVVEPFHGGFPNAELSVGAVGIYVGSKHRELAASFLQFLTSEEYNLETARGGDALPPLPAYAHTTAYNRPPEHPNEWGTHEHFVAAAADIGIGVSRSPYVLPNVVNRIEIDAYNTMLAGRLTPEQASLGASQRINDEIALSLKTNPRLRARHARESALQQRIDAHRARGEPVPAAWISNPFHLAYYAAQGWLAPADVEEDHP